MFGIVASNDDELALAIQIERVDDVEAARPIAPARRLDAPSEQQPEDVEEEQRGDEKRHERPEVGQELRLGEVGRHEFAFSFVVRRENAI